jgi:hypothetical protein
MTLDVLTLGSMDQYVKEERSLLAKRATSENKRLLALMDCMREDHISSAEKIKELRIDLFALTRDVHFKKARNMGEILQAALDFVTRNYQSENPFINSGS